MKAMLNSVFIFFLIICAMQYCYCQEESIQGEIKTVEGTAEDMDFVGSKIVVLVFENDMIFLITDDTKITRGDEGISINDIDVNDPLLIKYRDSDTEPYEAISIIDNNLANE